MQNSITNDQLIGYVADQFRRTYFKGIPRLHNDDGAFLSFTCCLMATESLGGFLKPKGGNGERFRNFVESYFPDPLCNQSETLWKFRNAMVHAVSPGPYALTHNHRNLHLTTNDGRTVLNAEDFYDAFVHATERYFNALSKDAALQALFLERTNDPKTGIMVVIQATSKSHP